MDVLEELTEFEPEIDRTHVERRVLDWEARIAALYSEVIGWLPEGWHADQSGVVVMNEPLMQDYGVAARDLPVLSLKHRGGVTATLVPRGLWIIGANGRIDLVGQTERFVIIDGAENFERSHWEISPFLQRRHRKDLTRSSLADALA